MSIFLQTSDIT